MEHWFQYSLADVYKSSRVSSVRDCEDIQQANNKEKSNDTDKKRSRLFEITEKSIVRKELASTF
ncbi:uncharacterized protein PHALS_14716 [Plasmopara halstedii]|uniref:Uncharacterized protein n=1 Tax=Plasmopara halstedii TaxID=4781 RepID=A0A0P1A4R5_PLAHL|nr:uncharacterized protein PHALS_14716 [Plasmopara halstedii]CEG35079.1 hypothetical protein PHALS_14716 [Plasmopara halstedii]|eukprot:XP_024571448.1 hypothetical protein PHALS_14716 [Plasmopara halstedii]